MVWKAVKDIRRFADEDSETIGRDVLRIALHRLADDVQNALDSLDANYAVRIRKMAASHAETAAQNERLRVQSKGLGGGAKVFGVERLLGGEWMAAGGAGSEEDASALYGRTAKEERDCARKGMDHAQAVRLVSTVIQDVKTGMRVIAETRIGQGEGKRV